MTKYVLFTALAVVIVQVGRWAIRQNGFLTWWRGLPPVRWVLRLWQGPAEEEKPPWATIIARHLLVGALIVAIYWGGLTALAILYSILGIHHGYSYGWMMGQTLWFALVVLFFIALLLAIERIKQWMAEEKERDG